MRLVHAGFSKFSIAKAALCSAFLACGLAAYASLPGPIRFDSAATAHAKIEKSGLYIACLGSPYGFYVSDHPLTADDLENVGVLKDCGLTPKWRGIVRISQIKTSLSTMEPNCIDGNWRAWGNVVAVGDARLISAIEASFR